MALFDDYRQGNSGIHIEAYRIVPQGGAQGQPQPPVLVRLRVIRFSGPAGDFSCHRRITYLGFHPRQLRIPQAVPWIVSSVAERLDERLRRCCKSRLLRLASSRAAEDMRTALKLIVNVVTRDIPGWSVGDVWFMHDRMRTGALSEEEEEKAAVVRNYYFFEGVSVDHARQGRAGYGDVPAGKSSVRRPTMPASRLFIDRLECMKYGQITDVWEGYCAVCMEVFKARDEVSKTLCCHTFHKTCITRWLKRSYLCPVCRYEMPTFSCWIDSTSLIFVLYGFFSAITGTVN